MIHIQLNDSNKELVLLSDLQTIDTEHNILLNKNQISIIDKNQTDVISVTLPSDIYKNIDKVETLKILKITNNRYDIIKSIQI